MTPKEQHEDHDGKRWLSLVGLEDRIGTKIYPNGNEMLVEDFPEACPDHVRDTFSEFERMSPNDPRFDQLRRILREQCESMFNLYQP